MTSVASIGNISQLSGLSSVRKYNISKLKIMHGNICKTRELHSACRWTRSNYKEAILATHWYWVNFEWILIV